MTISKNDWEAMQQWLNGNSNGVPKFVFKQLMDEYLEDQKRVRVGVAFIIRKGSAVLVGRRRDEKGRSRGHNTWALPGGHLEYKETVVDCAVRETREETGLEICNVQQGPYVNNIFGEDGRHYVTLFVTADLVDFSAEPKVMEPEKCFEWHWGFCSPDDKVFGMKPEYPFFPPLQAYMERYQLFLGKP